MSNAVTTTGMEMYSNKVIPGLTRMLAPLRGFSLDFTDELKQPGKSLEVALVSPDAAGDFNRENNNFSRDPTTAKSVVIEKSKAVIAGFAVTATQYSTLRPAWWEGKADLNVEAVGDNICGKVAALITPENYGDTATDKFAAPLAKFGKNSVALIRAAAIKKNLRPNRSVLCLHPDYFSALLGNLDANVYGGREAIVGGAIPGLLGFRMICEIPQLTVPGFVCHSDAIAIGSAIFTPVSKKPYELVNQIVEPTTGLTMTVVEYPDGATGDLSETINCLAVVGVGNEGALLRLLE